MSILPPPPIGGAASLEPLVAPKDRSTISLLVQKVLSQLPEEKGISFSESEKRELEERLDLDEAVRSIEEIASSKEPFADSVLFVLMNTDLAMRFQEESKSVRKGREFFDFLLEQAGELTSYKKYPEKALKAGDKIEKMLDVKGPMGAIYGETKEAFSRIDFIDEVLNVCTLMGRAASTCFKAAIFVSAKRKLQELQALPETELITTQKKRLEAFLTAEKKAMIKDWPSTALKVAEESLGATKWALELAQEAQGEVPGLEIAGASVGLALSGIGVLNAGRACFKANKKRGQYNQWLRALEHELPKELTIPGRNQDEQHRVKNCISMALEPPLEEEGIQKLVQEELDDLPELHAAVIEQIRRRVGSQRIYQEAIKEFSKEDCIRRPSSDVQERQRALQQLREKVQEWLKETELSKALVPHMTSLVMRHLTQEMEVVRCGSVEKAAQKQRLTSSIKSGLTNLAIRKQAIEKKLLLFNFSMKIGKLAMAIFGLVVGVLTIAALLAPPLSTFIALGLAAGSFLLVGAGVLHQWKTQPNLFKATWGSLDSWMLPFRQFVSKFYSWRLARLEAQKTELEEKLAPTCYKISLLEHLQHASFKKIQATAPTMGVKVTKAKETRQAIQEKIVALQKTITKDDRVALEHVQASMDVLSQKVASVEEKISRTEERFKEIDLSTQMKEVQKEQAWSRISEVLSRFEEGVVDNLVREQELCIPILQELEETTGIAFDAAAIDACRQGCQETCAQLLDAEEPKRRAYEVAERAFEKRPRLRMKLRSLPDLPKAEEEFHQAHQAKMEAYKPLLDMIRKPIEKFLRTKERDFTKIKL